VSPTRTPTPAATAGGCAAAVTIPSEGGVFTGTTAGASTLAASCGESFNAPENVYRWVPARSGTALLETCSAATTYDTIVSVRQPSCESGPERACNDDTVGCATGEPHPYHGSRVSVPVTAGVAYFIVVDGFGTKRGTYELRVMPPP
jgi:hypothetical protein